VVVDVGDGCEVSVMCGLVDGNCWRVDVWVCTEGCAECVEREDVEEVVFVEEWLCVRVVPCFVCVLVV